MLGSPVNKKSSEPLVDLWQKLIDERPQSAEQGQTNQSNSPTNASLNQSMSQREATLLYVGPAQSGKTSLIGSYMFKDRIDTPKPTYAIDYRYTRTSIKQPTNPTLTQSIKASMNDDKSLSHFFESGGGDLLIDCLIDQSINVKSIKHTLVLVVIDCSRTSNVLADCSNYLSSIRTKIDAKIRSMKQASSQPNNQIPNPLITPNTSNNPTNSQTTNQTSQVINQLVQQQRKRFGEVHPDITRVNLMPVQTLIIANKYDTIANVQPEELRVFCHNLRLLAHRNGCGLMFTSQQNKDQLNKTYRSRISHHLMGSEKKPSPVLSHLEMLAIPPGGDSYALIGHPYDQPNQSKDSKEQWQPDALQEEWQSLFTEYFPFKQSEREQAINKADLQLQPEPLIDRLVDQKTEELKKRQRELELQKKLIEQDNKIKV